jgi:phenylalanyl-tRNA synthetase beta chain
LKKQKTFLSQEELFTIWDAKNQLLEVLHSIWGLSEDSFSFKPYINKNFHTKQSFEIYLGKKRIAILAQVHPLTLDKFEIKQKVFSFEVKTTNLPAPKIKKPSYEEDILPDVIREIAIIIKDEVSFESVFSSIKKLRILSLKDISIKDIFKSENRIGKGMKSLSLKFLIKQGSQTLTKEQIDNEIIGSIVSKLKIDHNAQLRDGEAAQ